jgi:hypothetical protein
MSQHGLDLGHQVKALHFQEFVPVLSTAVRAPRQRVPRGASRPFPLSFELRARVLRSVAGVGRVRVVFGMGSP